MMLHRYVIATIISFGLGLMFITSGCGQRPLSTAPETSYSSLSGAIKHNITYNTVDNVSLQMDIYFPAKLNGKTPAVLYVHGGGWTSGDKAVGAGSGDVSALRAAGFIVVPINYRLAPRFKFPAMIEDVKCAVRFLRAHALEYGIDTDKIGAYGGSAGGHLVSLLGVTDQSAGWDIGPDTVYSSRVQAVVDMFGPADLPALFSGSQQVVAQSVFGTSDPKSPILARASPVSWISRDDPPFLILQGDHDTVVPLSQSQEFYTRLTGAGVDTMLVVVKNGTHGLNGSPDMQPTRQDLTKMLVDFFVKHL
jgi:acetyl esterase/lipase